MSVPRQHVPETGFVPASAQYPETTVLLPVGATRVIEFVPQEPGDWAMHCHMTHHVMMQMGANRTEACPATGFLLVAPGRRSSFLRIREILSICSRDRSSPGHRIMRSCRTDAGRTQHANNINQASMEESIRLLHVERAGGQNLFLPVKEIEDGAPVAL
jgi:hypothetical protein